MQTSSTLSQAPSSIDVPIMRNFSIQGLKRTKLSSSFSSSTATLSYNFINIPTIEVDDDNQFSVLGWWKSNQSLCPIVSLMACDFLTILVSTVVSKSCLSVGGRVVWEEGQIESKCNRGLICLKDWALENLRMQDATQDEQCSKELMNYRASRPYWMATSEDVKSECDENLISQS